MCGFLLFRDFHNIIQQSPSHCRLRDSSIMANPTHTFTQSVSLNTITHSFCAPPHPHPSCRGAFSSSQQIMTLASCQVLSITSNLWSGEKFVCEGGRTHAKLLAAATVFSPADTVASEFTQMSSTQCR